MSATETVNSSDESGQFDGGLFAEIGSNERFAYDVDELAQYCFKCKERVSVGIWSVIGFVHEPCADTLTQENIQAYHLSFSQSSEGPSHEEIDLKAGKHSNFKKSLIRGPFGGEQEYLIRKGIYVDNHQRKHNPGWIGRGATGGTVFPKMITRKKDDFVKLLNQIVDSSEMTKVLSNPPKDYGPVDDIEVTLKKPLKYLRQDRSLRGKSTETVRVQLAYQEQGWTFHAYPIIPGVSK